MKRKGIKMTLIIVSVLAIIVAVIALGISPFAKSYIEKHSKELIGRKVLMKDLRLNVFTGTLRLDSICVCMKQTIALFLLLLTRFSLTCSCCLS